jgi:SAM-dependent methyltransferase
MSAGGSTEAHWQRIYDSRAPEELSWFQAEPRSSLRLIETAGLDTQARILDAGGGASRLVDALLERGYENLGVLDVAPTALDLVRERLGERASEVEFILGDVRDFTSPGGWDLWHDRAVFHFLMRRDDRERYGQALRAALAPGGRAIVATFGPEGPPRCSGLDVVRYSPESLREAIGPGFELLASREEQHRTPGGAVQQFIYCLFLRTGT